jgi:O-antigen/teichoic acid export membrane protein
MAPSDDGAIGGLGSLRSITEGAGLYLLGRLNQRVLAVVLNVLLTRVLGVRLYGVYAYTKLLLKFANVLGRLGGDKSMMRFVPEYADQSHLRNRMVTLAFVGAVIASVVTSAGIYVAAPFISAATLDEPIFTEVLRVASFVLPFLTLSRIIGAVFKGLDRMDYNVAVISGLQPLLRLLFVGGAVLLGYSIVGAVAGLVVAGILTFLVGIMIIVKRTDINFSKDMSRNSVLTYYDFSIPLVFNQMGSILYNRVDILIVGFFLSGTVVGIYNVSVLVSAMIALPLLAFNQMFAPIASELYHNGSVKELQDVYKTVTRWIFQISLLPVIGVFVYSQEILAVFGPKFGRGAAVLLLFAIAQLTNCAVGPSGYLLMMTGHQYLNLVNQVGAGIVNVILNVVLILEFGFIGAAVSTATVLTAINGIRVVEIWYLEGFFPYDRTYLKAVVGGAVAGIVMVMVSITLSGFAALVIGGVLGVFGFAFILAALGVERAEKELFRTLINR